MHFSSWCDASTPLTLVAQRKYLSPDEARRAIDGFANSETVTKHQHQRYPAITGTNLSPFIFLLTFSTVSVACGHSHRIPARAK